MVVEFALRLITLCLSVLSFLLGYGRMALRVVLCTSRFC